MAPLYLPRLLAADSARFFLYKPPGLPIFPPHSDPQGDCLLRWWLQQGGTSDGWPKGFEGGIAHRLDNNTDGLVVVAKDLGELEKLRAQFSSGQLRKFYHFRSQGQVEFSEMLCELPIAHHARRADRMVVQRGAFSRHRGKWYPAWTRFKRLEAGIWSAEIRTGVMHQIRVHAAAVGLPLDGDTIYEGAEAPFLLQHQRIIGPDWSFSLETPPQP